MGDFAIHDLAMGSGKLGLSPLPGRTGEYAADLDTVLDWRPALVITMTTMAELVQGGADSFGHDLATAGILWRHLPTADFGVISAKGALLWPDVSVLARGLIAKGALVLVHCHGGCGRSGMAALRLMIEAGEAPDVALIRLRGVRPCAVETDAQLSWARDVPILPTLTRR